MINTKKLAEILKKHQSKVNLAEYLKVTDTAIARLQNKADEELLKFLELNLNIVQIPFFKLDENIENAGREFILIDKIFIKNMENPVLIECTEDIPYADIYKGALILAEPLVKKGTVCKWIIKTGAIFEIYECMKAGKNIKFYMPAEDRIARLSPDETYYAVKRVMQ